MSVTKVNNIIQYVPFKSFVHPSFWHTLTEMKLDVDKLSDTSKEIYGRYTYRGDIESVFEVDGTSFNKTPEIEQFYHVIKGIIINKNTIEDFKAVDKATLLNSIGESLWTNIKQKMWITKPSLLMTFLTLSFADLKKFNYYYWFAYPVPSQPTLYIKEKSQITDNFNKEQLQDLSEGFKSLELEQKCFFIVMKNDTKISVKPLSEVLCTARNLNHELNMSTIYFAFADPSNGVNPGWPLRIFLASLLDHWPDLCNMEINVISVRCDMGGNIENSLLLIVSCPQDIQPVESAGWVGWERNDKGNFGPKIAYMAASMDPVKLADTASDLNIKLMKWRLLPELDMNILKSTKCLLLGAGTLGCHVARDLLAWGFRNITFIDNGNVSYSNPTRQILFNFRDCIPGGKAKAEAAASALISILPTVNSKGIVAHIPMPGHPIGEALKAETVTNIKTICDAIEEHDVIFLLLDTREARWMPTLIAAHHGKIVINAALGFDSYLVMRHGSGLESPMEPHLPVSTSAQPSHILGGQLGCYFCNDVTAPGNSTRDRTLDQQCTVTRPGAAAVAGALAVELLVALLHHPMRANAPAIYNMTGDIEKGLPDDLGGVLGLVPHSIRGFLHSFHNVVPTCIKFQQCVACSNVVLSKYKEEGIEFLMKAFSSGKYLEDITGLSEMHLSAEMTDILMLADEDDEDTD